MSIPWYLAAIGAAIIWGIHYPLIDFAMKRLSVYSVLLISVLPVLFLMPMFLRDVARDVEVFKLLPTNEQWLVAAIGLTSTLGAVLLYLSVNSKNATLASLIEITYPVFVVLFAYLFFRQVHVNTSVILGGLMILVGAGLIIYNNQ
ncbi:MAG: DMT family transporter [Gammaproteobacteria bacterium]|nr:DMT family transporter [Gammaproteobacteria bacterium]